MIKLNDRVKDSITGYEGLVIGICKYLNGCVSCLVQSEKNIDKSFWIDEQRLTAHSAATAGGPQSEPPELHP